MKKIIVCAILVTVLAMTLTSCFEYGTTITGSQQDARRTQDAANTLQTNQATPTDIDYSLERYNLIRRAYWVNGQREKAINLPCEVTKPVGYVTLFAGSAVVGSFTVDGKVSSLNSFLTPDSEYYEYSGSTRSSSATYYNHWLADVDGSYGENDSGIFFFTTDGKYVEWNGGYLYTDIPMKVDNPVITFNGGN